MPVNFHQVPNTRLLLFYFRRIEAKVKSNPKDIWKIVHCKHGLSRIPGIPSDGINEYTNPQDVNAFIELFSNVFLSDTLTSYPTSTVIAYKLLPNPLRRITEQHVFHPTNLW
ncbi:hypothetical protein Trydic_g23820 [Trypoxylus dichotomus]